MIASYHDDHGELGPANAQGQLNTLFDEDAYSIIRNTPPEVVYRVFILGEIMSWYLYKLKYKRNYVADVAGYVKFSLFSVICRSINKIDPRAWHKDSFEKFLEVEYDSDTTDGNWEKFIKSAIDFILSFYEKTQEEAIREGWTLTPANFFKTKSYVAPVLRSPLPRSVSQLSKNVFDF